MTVKKKEESFKVGDRVADGKREGDIVAIQGHTACIKVDKHYNVLSSPFLSVVGLDSLKRVKKTKKVTAWVVYYLNEGYLGNGLDALIISADHAKTANTRKEYAESALIAGTPYQIVKVTRTFEVK